MNPTHLTYDSQNNMIDVLANSSPGQVAVAYAAQSYQQENISPPVQPTVTQFQQHLISPTQFPATQSPSLQQNPIQFIHPTKFFYRPLNDFCHYYVNCEIISHDNLEHLLNKLKEQNIQSNENECIFYYSQQYNDQFYQISCEIVSPILVSNCLNEKYGISLRYEEIDEHLTFKLGQKENLELHLKQHLSQYLLN